MQPLLLDKGLPWTVAQALATLGLPADAVGLPGGPAENSPDDENCRWCLANGAVLVTNDRGKTNRAIIDALASYRVHAIFVYNDLRTGPAYPLARALLNAEGHMDTIVANRRRLIRHRLTPNGGLRQI